MRPPADSYAQGDGVIRVLRIVPNDSTASGLLARPFGR